MLTTGLPCQHEAFSGCWRVLLGKKSAFVGQRGTIVILKGALLRLIQRPFKPTQELLGPKQGPNRSKEDPFKHIKCLLKPKKGLPVTTRPSQAEGRAF